MEIVCQKVVQNNVEFFVGKVTFADLSKISTVSHRIILGFDEHDKPLYNDSFQRKVNSTRSNDIKNYILNDEEATFPNSIILSIPSVLLKSEIEDGLFPVIDIDDKKVDLDSETPVYVQIIDGQHRFSGMKAAVKQLEESGNIELLKKVLDFV